MLRVVSLAEWSSEVIPDLALSAEDRRMVDKLDEAGRSRLRIEELRKGLRITSSSWVGVVRLSQLEIRVVPKLAGEQVGLVRLIEFTTGLDALRRTPAVRTLDDQGASLLDLIALLFAEAAEGVARRGLIGDYIEQQDELPAVRGRILADRQIIERFGLVDRVICRFDEHEQNIPDNQLIAAALSVCIRRITHPLVKRHIHRQFAVFGAVADPEALDLETARRTLTHHRLNEHYREAHQLAWLILDSLGVEDLLASGKIDSFAFLLNMNTIFERFVERVVRWTLRNDSLQVRSQSKHQSILWHVEQRRAYARVIPDLLIQANSHGARKLPIDAKYKLYDEQKISPTDLYQTLLYAFAFGAAGPDVIPRAMLIYPASSKGQTLRVQVRRDQLSHAEVFATALPIVAVLDEIDSGTPGFYLNLLRSRICDR